MSRGRTRGVFYRGDKRDPYDEEGIFAVGFQRQDSTATEPAARFPIDENHAFDIVTSTAVCLTKDFYASALFPVDTRVLITWIYLLDLDVLDMYNTQQLQHDYVRGLVEKKQISGPGVADALWPMFGQERAVMEVDIEDIIGAVQIFRSFNGGAILQGGQFCLWWDGYVANPNYTGPDFTITQAKTAIDTIMGTEAGPRAKWITMPVKAKGIVAAYQQ